MTSIGSTIASVLPADTATEEPKHASASPAELEQAIQECRALLGKTVKQRDREQVQLAAAREEAARLGRWINVLIHSLESHEDKVSQIHGHLAQLLHQQRRAQGETIAVLAAQLWAQTSRDAELAGGPAMGPSVVPDLSPHGTTGLAGSISERPAAVDDMASHALVEPAQGREPPEAAFDGASSIQSAQSAERHPSTTGEVIDLGLLIQDPAAWRTGVEPPVVPPRKVESAAIGSERREHPRKAVSVEVGLQSESNFWVGFSHDISQGGLFVATYDTLPEGSEVQVTFCLPGHPEPICVAATVRWVRDYREDLDHGETAIPGMGVRFIDLSEADQRAIADFIQIREPLFFPDFDDA
jgi:uncharacterized protein (TIGR02266 family)